MSDQRAMRTQIGVPVSIETVALASYLTTREEGFKVATEAMLF